MTIQTAAAIKWGTQQSFETWIDSNHCALDQSAISIVWNLNQTRITVHCTSQPYLSFETWIRLESLCIAPVSHTNRLEPESDSNHCAFHQSAISIVWNLNQTRITAFHQSAKNHTVVRTKACEELRTLEVIARCKHSNRQQNYCLGPVGLVSGSAINTAF